MSNANQIVQNLESLRAQIREATQAANRDPDEINLVAVSKLHPAESISCVVEAGHFDIGENYLQEASEKQNILQDPRIVWHFIGQVQSKKAKFLVGRFHLIHSVDRIKLADALESRAKEKNLVQPILLQVNVSREPQKGGIHLNDLKSLVEHIIEHCTNLDLQGLMCMPPFFDQGEKVRPYFSELRELKNQIQKEMQINLPHLSMGMSGDFYQAIQEGATLLRIGTSIFGAREY